MQKSDKICPDSQELYWTLVATMEPLVLTPATGDDVTWRLLLNEAAQLEAASLEAFVRLAVGHACRCPGVAFVLEDVMRQAPTEITPAHRAWSTLRNHYFIGREEEVAA